jgi:hypothetical protein
MLKDEKDEEEKRTTLKEVPNSRLRTNHNNNQIKLPSN